MSFKEAIEKHDKLNPKLWTSNNELKPEVKSKIREIVQKFDDNLKENDVELDVKDICIIGSNANYNYTPDSDVDIHIIADTSVYPDQEDLAMKVYLAYKSLFNQKYDPMLNGIEAEIYVEPDSVKANSNGVYSLNNGWLKEPEQVNIPEISAEHVQELIDPYEKRYNELIKSDPSVEDVDKLIDDIYLQRQSSILKDGEFGDGNICFKEFRNRGYLQDLRDLKVELENRDMSLEEMNGQILSLYDLKEDVGDSVPRKLTKDDLYVGRVFVEPEEAAELTITGINDDLVTYEISQNDGEAFPVTDYITYVLTNLNEFEYIPEDELTEDKDCSIEECDDPIIVEDAEADKREIQRIYSFLEEHKLYPDEIYYDAYHRLNVEIYNGDWKHEHMWLDRLMWDLGYNKEEETLLDDNGEDTYSSIHQYTLYDVQESLDEGTAFDSMPGFLTPEEARALKQEQENKLNAEKEEARAKKVAKRKEEAKAERERQKRIDQREKVNSLSYDSLADMAGLDEENNDLTKDELLAILRSDMSDADILKMHKRMFEDVDEAWEPKNSVEADIYRRSLPKFRVTRADGSSFTVQSGNFETIDDVRDYYKFSKIKDIQELKEDFIEEGKGAKKAKLTMASKAAIHRAMHKIYSFDPEEIYNYALDHAESDFVKDDLIRAKDAAVGFISSILEASNYDDLEEEVGIPGGPYNKDLTDEEEMALGIDNEYPEDVPYNNLEEEYEGYDLIFDRDTGDREVEYGINWIQFNTTNYDDAVRWIRQLNASIARDFDVANEPSDDSKYYDPENYPRDIQQLDDGRYNFRRRRDILDKLPKTKFVSIDDPVEYDDEPLYPEPEPYLAQGQQKFNESDEGDSKATALANYLDISVDDMSDGYSDGIYEADGGEYFVGTEDEAYQRAKDDIASVFDDLGLDSFSSTFQDWILNNAIDVADIDDIIQDEIDFYSEEDDEDMLDYLNSLDTDEAKLEFVKDLYADNFSDWAKDHVDLDAVADEAISSDGVANFIAYYDGEEIDLGNGLFAYRLG